MQQKEMALNLNAWARLNGTKPKTNSLRLLCFIRPFYSRLHWLFCPDRSRRGILKKTPQIKKCNSKKLVWDFKNNVSTTIFLRDAWQIFQISLAWRVKSISLPWGDKRTWSLVKLVTMVATCKRGWTKELLTQFWVNCRVCLNFAGYVPNV